MSTSKRSKDREDKFIQRGLKNLAEKKILEAYQDFKLVKWHLGRSIAAFMGYAYERSLSQALMAYQHPHSVLNQEEKLALKIMKICISKLERKKKLDNIDYQNIEKAKDYLSNVKSWDEVEDIIKKQEEAFPFLKDLTEEIWTPEVEKLVNKINEGWWFIEKGDLSSAKEFFSRLAGEYPRISSPVILLLHIINCGISKRKCREFIQMYGYERIEKMVSDIKQMPGPINTTLGTFYLNYATISTGKKSSDLVLRSIKHFKKAYNCRENIHLVSFKLGICYEKLGKYPEAEKWYKLVIKQKNTELYKEAIDRYSNCLNKIKISQLERENLRFYNLAKKYQEHKQIVEEYNILKKINPKFCSERKSVHERIVELKILLHKKVYLEDLKRLLSHNPQNKTICDYISAKGIKYAEEHKYTVANKYFDLISKLSKKPNFIIAYAKSLEKTKRFSDAIKIYQDFISISQCFYVGLLRCQIEKGCISDAGKTLSKIFTKIDDCKLLEETVCLIKDIVPSDKTVELCEKILQKHPKNNIALEIKKDVSNKKIKAYEELKNKIMKAYKNKNWSGTIKLSKDILPERIDNEVCQILAESHWRLNDYSNAIKLYNRCHTTKDTLIQNFDCLLNTNEVSAAKKLVEENIDILREADLTQFPDIKGVLLEINGDYLNAIKVYENEKLLERLSKKFVSEHKITLSLNCMLKLYKNFRKKRYKIMINNIIKKHDDRIPVRRKAEVPFDIDMPEMIICDTNVWVYMAHYELNLLDYYYEYTAAEKTLDNFKRLSSKGYKMVMTKTIKNEILTIHTKRNKKIRAKVHRKLEEYIQKYGPPIDVDGQEYLSKVIDFYKHFPSAIEKITREKFERILHKNKSRALDFLKKRGAKSIYTQGKKSMTCSGGTMPEPTDIKILAEAITLCESYIPGISKIGVLTNDADFKEFGSEIERRFWVIIY